MMLGLIALTEANNRVIVRVWETAPVVGSVTNKDTVKVPLRALAGTTAVRVVVDAE
jgi:hypothetical protein